jgi:ATP-dependent Clp protease ATP-binding subunit ClpA
MENHWDGEEIAGLKNQIEQKESKGSLVQEEVRSEDIAEVVAKWTEYRCRGCLKEGKAKA